MSNPPLPSNENDLVFVLLGDQLFDPKHLKSAWCKQVILIEDFGLCSEQKHHKLKLYLYLCAMREYRDELTRSSITVHYTELEDHSQKDDEWFLEGALYLLLASSPLEVMNLLFD